MKGSKCEKAKLTLTLSIICSLDHDDYVDMIDSLLRYVKHVPFFLVSLEDGEGK